MALSLAAFAEAFAEALDGVEVYCPVSSKTLETSTPLARYCTC